NFSSRYIFSLCDTASSEFYSLSLHDALPIFGIADVGEMVGLRAFAHAGRLHLDEIADMGMGGEFRAGPQPGIGPDARLGPDAGPDRKSTRLNSSHVKISYAVFCLKKKNSLLF